MNLPQIFVSTGLFRTTPVEAIRTLRQEGVRSIELSGCSLGGDPISGLPSEAAGGALQVHNYFPPQQDPFVFNLCDPDPEGRARSLHLAREAIDLTLKLGSDLYSFHAGFLGTPSIQDLGRTWAPTQRISFDQGLSLFISSVNELAAYAQAHDVRLLVENNVITKGTAETNGDDILLMTTPNGIREVLELLPQSVRLLMDVAHLNVSASTLGFDRFHGLDNLSDLIDAYHLSDNDGLTDSNQPISEDSWFWDAIRPATEFVTLEIRPSTGVNMYEQVQIAEQRLKSSVA